MPENFAEPGWRESCSMFYFRQGTKKGIVSRKSGQWDPRSLLAYHNTDGVPEKMLQANMFGENARHFTIGEHTSGKECVGKHEDKWLPPPKKVRFGMEPDGSNCVRGENREGKLEVEMGSISAKLYAIHRTDGLVDMGSAQDIENPSTVNHDGSVCKSGANIYFKHEALFSVLGNVQKLFIYVFDRTSV